jgi:GGDEF domain-containing protein
MGGDEFVCGMAGIRLEDARRRLTEISDSVEGGSFAAGLTTVQPEDTVETVVERCDAAMRRARASAAH